MLGDCPLAGRGATLEREGHFRAALLTQQAELVISSPTTPRSSSSSCTVARTS